ncbi:penicillin-binding transpeptidase domain-containing protein [Clostridium tunisiense]|uniref:penicillin-binding transpeptidase domain-containing protein n=1 Tax=Clostridium tunisiense TaxID=219748 RepID=UPI00031B5167|nr:penicillin-binding transpeptidase domain-containing protein [Clostridium tunisiense]
MSFNIRGNKQKILGRTYALTSIMIVLFIVLSLRLAYIQLFDNSSLQTMANRQYYYEENIKNMPYKLLDRESEELFNYEKKYYAVIDINNFITMNSKENLAEIQSLTYTLRNYNKDYDLTLIKYSNQGKQYYNIDKTTYEKLKDVKTVKGFYVYESNETETQINSNIRNVITRGTKVSDSTKLKDEGTLEREVYEYVKDNKYTKIRFEKDVSGNIIDEKIVENKGNVNVKLTLDKNVQELSEKVLRDDKYKSYGQIGVVMMEADSGKILSMALKDDYGNNVNIGTPSENGFYVGSIFKTIVYEAALDEEIVGTKETFNLINGLFPKSKEKKYSYNMKEAFISSSNNTFAQIGWRVGIENLYNYSKKQGLFSNILNLQDEKVGEIEGYPSKNSEEIITNTSIGQTVRATPLAALTIPNTVVNNGVYVKPIIIDSLIKEDGTVVKKYNTESERVINKATAQTLKNSMIEVVNNDLGTGKKAMIPGMEVGGKTGTTEYFVKDKDNQNIECSDGWFAGFFKYNNKYYSMVVFVPQILGNDAGGGTASYVFKDIVQGIVENKYLK